MVSKRDRKLHEYQIIRNDLIEEMKIRQAEKKNATNRVLKTARRLKDVGNAIYDLKHGDAKTPHVTDHAIVRYLERVEEYDINELKLKVAKDKNAVRQGNAIVTVNADFDNSDTITP